MGYSQPRDIVTVQNGFDLFQRKLRITASLDYKGGFSRSTARPSFLLPAVSVVSRDVEPGVELVKQARAAAYRFGTRVARRDDTTSDAGLPRERPVLALPRSVGAR